MDRTIRTIARVIRVEMEKFAQRDDLHPYNGDDLACLCAISSWFMTNLARKFKRTIHCAMGYFDMDNGKYDIPEGCINHTWNVYRRQIIDVTATQFDNMCVAHRKVHYTTTSDPVYNFQLWANNHKAFVDWPCDQNPYEFEDVLDKHMEAAVAKLKQAL